MTTDLDFFFSQPNTNKLGSNNIYGTQRCGSQQDKAEKTQHFQRPAAVLIVLSYAKE
jgi:hypothetical protein